MHIRLTKFLEVGLFNGKYDLKERLHEEYTGTCWSNDDEIKEIMAVDNNKNNNEENLQEKNRRLKKEK